MIFFSVSTVMFSLLKVLQSGTPIEILTAGALPSLSINLRFGLAEGVFAVSINLMARRLARGRRWWLRGRWRRPFGAGCCAGSRRLP